MSNFSEEIQTVYKLKVSPLVSNSYITRPDFLLGHSIYKRGGSGKTWTSTVLVNKNFNIVKDYLKRHKLEDAIKLEIVVYELKAIDFCITAI